MEDTREEEDGSTSDELANVETENAEDTAETPVDGEVVDDSGTAEETDATTEEAVVDELDVLVPKEEQETDENGKVIPYGRFREVVEQKNDLKEQNKTLLALLAQKGIAPDGSAATKQEKDQANVDLSKYSPKQIAEAKALLGTVLKDEFDQLGQQVESVKQKQAKLDSLTEEQRKTEFAKADEQEMVSALKTVKGEFTKEVVTAQILKWDKSGNPQLQSLARAPYTVILREMQRMKQARKAKAPAKAPKVPAAGGGDGAQEELPRPRDPQRARPRPGDSEGYAASLAENAFKRMQTDGE